MKTLKHTTLVIFLLGSVMGLQAQELVPFKDGYNWGYKNEKGEIVIKPDFSNDSKFIDGFAKVKLESGYGIINSKGNVIVEFEVLFKDEVDKMLRKPVLQSVLKDKNLLLRHPFYGSFCILSMEGAIIKDWTIGNVSPLEGGEYLIYSKVDNVFEGDRRYNTQEGVIDHNGVVIIKASWTTIVHIKEDKFIVCNGNWVKFDEKTSLKIAKSMMNAKANEKWCVFQLQGKWGVIDINGKEILPLEFSFLNYGNDFVGSKICNGWFIVLQDYRGSRGSRYSSIDWQGEKCNEITIPFSEIGL